MHYLPMPFISKSSSFVLGTRMLISFNVSVLKMERPHVSGDSEFLHKWRCNKQLTWICGTHGILHYTPPLSDF